MKAKAFTVVELLVAIGIIAILISLIFPILSGDFAGRVSKVQCMANMRSLHVSFSSFVSDNDVWPPAPPDSYDENMAKSEEWWFNLMDPYTEDRKVWLCPILARSHIKSPQGDVLKMHYIPTQFDGTKMSPYRWPKQPWLIEMANAHGTGALVLFPDGSVTTMGELLNRK